MSGINNGILTKYEIQKYKLLIKQLKKPGEFIPVDNKKIQATTYDLSIGEAHFIYNEKGWEKIYTGDDDTIFKEYKRDGFKRQNKMRPKQLRIDPFCSAMIQLDEIVDTFNVCDEHNLLIAGRFDLKLKMVSQGLISQQATQVEPFYKGRLFCYVHNLLSETYKLEFREPFATIEFSYVSDTIDDSEKEELIKDLRKNNKIKYGGKYCLKEKDKSGVSVNKGIQDIRYFLFSRNKLPDHFGISPLLENRMKNYIDENLAYIAKRVESRTDIKLKLLFLVLSVLIPTFISIFGPNIPGFYNFIKNKINSFSQSTQEDPNPALNKNGFDNIP